jgi:hypothetical protein
VPGEKKGYREQSRAESGGREGGREERDLEIQNHIAEVGIENCESSQINESVAESGERLAHQQADLRRRQR